MRREDVSAELASVLVNSVVQAEVKHSRTHVYELKLSSKDDLVM
jgi:hypothetical protein